MPLRKTPLETDYIYHILNRSVSQESLFRDERDYHRFLEASFYYKFSFVIPRFSFFKNLKEENQLMVLKRGDDKFVSIIAYCLMPNHFHFLLKQLKEDGITIFMNRLTNSYSRYFNLKHIRQGTLFQGRFKAILVKNDEQLLHLTRYIHLNPYASGVVKNTKELENYPWSSFREYLKRKKTNQITKDVVLDFFQSKESFKQFTLDQADYAKELERIKRLTLE